MQRIALWGVVVSLVVVVAMMAGCGGGNDQLVYQNVSERTTYSADGSRLAFASLGGNGLLYVYSIYSGGGGLQLLTYSDNDQDLTDEGGKMPAWAPNGNDLCIVGRRGGSQALFFIDPSGGDTVRISKLTDDTTLGADAMPSWSADSARLVFASDKRLPGGWDATNPGPTDVVTINRDGTGRTTQLADGAHNTWPVFSPDGTKILYTSDVTGNTDLWVMNVGDPASAVNLTAGSSARDEAGSWSPDGTKIAFHSNRAGDFDIWVVNADGSGATRLTNDSRSDGFPIWNPAGTRIAFTRDREVWTMLTDGTDQTQLTRRF